MIRKKNWIYRLKKIDWKTASPLLVTAHGYPLPAAPRTGPPLTADHWASSAAARDTSGSPPLTTCTPSQAGTPVMACHTRTLASPTAVWSHNAQNSGLTVTDPGLEVGSHTPWLPKLLISLCSAKGRILKGLTTFRRKGWRGNTWGPSRLWSWGPRKATNSKRREGKGTNDGNQ